VPALIEFPIDATGGLELRIAHLERTDGCDAICFPNQSKLPAYIERHAYIRGNEFVAARLVGPDSDGYYSVQLEVRESAAKKIDDLAKRKPNMGLGVFRRGEPVQLIHAVRGISGRTLSWHGFEAEQEARAMLEVLGGIANPEQAT
jgi:hypothetical protein